MPIFGQTQKVKTDTRSLMVELKHQLDIARLTGNTLKAALTENALNDLIERYLHDVHNVRQR